MRYLSSERGSLQKTRFEKKEEKTTNNWIDTNKLYYEFDEN